MVLKDHQIAELVNELTVVAKEYANTQQLRERISGTVLRALKPGILQPLVGRELLIYEFITEWKVRYNTFPSYEAIGEACDVSSRRSINIYLNKLQEKTYITRDKNGNRTL